jgi:outer membrane protein assembly factor BamB
MNSRRFIFALVILLVIVGVLWMKRSRERAIVPDPKPPLSAEEPAPPSTNSGPARVWTQFRGSDQGQVPEEQAVPLLWSETSNVEWKSELPGVGASSPVISEQAVWVSVALEGGRSLRAIGLDKATGKRLHDVELLRVASPPPTHKVNSLASPTPVLDKDRLWVSFGTHGLGCLRISDGKVLWTNVSLKFDDEKMGPGGSPILVGNLLVMQCDGTDERFIAGINKDTGEVVWKTPRSNVIAQAIPYRKAFSTPVLHALNDVPQLISSTSYRLFGYQPETGKELWGLETPGFCPVAVPLVRSNWIYVCTGFNKAELWAFRSEQAGKPPQQVWKTARSAPLVPSPVLAGDYLYMINDGGIASCLEAASGRVLWNERVGGTYWASLVHARGRIYCFAEDGTTTVLNTGPEFKALARNRLDGEIMATPAVADHALFLRTKTHLYRLQIKAARP